MKRDGVSDTTAADEGDVAARKRLASRGVKRTYTDPDAVNKGILGTVAATAGFPELKIGKMALRGAGKLLRRMPFAKRAEQAASTAVKRRGVPRGTITKNTTKGVSRAAQDAGARAKDAKIRALIKEHGGGYGVGSHVAKALGVTPQRARMLIRRATQAGKKK